jgi:leader peptidase (prepilin peptidase)/N-methyltransferase
MANGAVVAGACLLGACVGSFLNVVIHRVPRRQFFALGSRSVCPACGARIGLRDNVPVLSWLLLRGRARCCGAPIRARYPIVEATTALAFGVLAAMPPYVPPPDVPGLALVAFALHAWFLSVLIACSFIDAEFTILPDVLTIPTMVVGCVGALLVPGLAGTFPARDLAPATASLLWSAAGLAAGFGLTAAVRSGGSLLFRREAMGFGDVKLMGAVGAFVGPVDVLLVFFLGCVLGAAGGVLHRLATGQATVPFGPFLAAGAALVLLWGDAVRAFVDAQLFRAWPDWLARNAAGPWLLAALSLVCVLLLIVLIRRGRRL